MHTLMLQSGPFARMWIPGKAPATVAHRLPAAQSPFPLGIPQHLQRTLSKTNAMEGMSASEWCRGLGTESAEAHGASRL